MEQKQRVLQVHNYYKVPGGEDSVVANEKRLLEEHGHTVFLYSRSNKEMEAFSIVRKLLLPFTSLFSLHTYHEVKRLIREENIDIVHVHNTLSLVSPSVYYAAFSCKVPVVQTLHNFRMLCPAATFLREGKICEDCVDKGLGCAVRYSCYRGSKLQTLMSVIILKFHRILGTYKRLNYICLTEFNRKKFLQLNKGVKECIDAKRVFVKANFVRIPEIELFDRKEQYIYIGRLEEAKGIYILLEAWRAFPKKPLLVCGSGPEEEKIRDFIERNQMHQVELRGQCTHEEVLRLLSESKALLMPTLWYEGQPMVIMEAYAVGTPVIASDIGNSGNMVLPGVSGMKFTCGDAQDLRKAVTKLENIKGWDTRSLYEKMYSVEKNYMILQDIYKKVQGNER